MLGIPRTTSNLSRPLGTAGVYLFGIGAFAAPAAANVAFGLLLLALFLDGRRAWATLRGDATLWLLAGFVLYLACALRWGWPREWREVDLDTAQRLVKLWLFLPLAYWLGGDTERIERFLLCVLLGFMVGRLAGIDWLGQHPHPTDGRLRLAISSINHFGYYAATLLLGLLAYTGTLWQATAGGDRRLRWGLRGAWALTALTALYWMLASQSRGAIGALLIALVFCALLVGFLRGKRLTLILLGLIGAGTLVVGLIAGGVVVKRFAAESGTLSVLLNWGWWAVPLDNTGLRVDMVVRGWQWWLDHPWLGQGTGALQELIAQLPELRCFKHLHNTLIDNLARLGLIGTLLLQALFLVVTLALWRGLRAGIVPLALGVFGLGALVLSFFFGQTDYRMGAWDWRHYWIVIGGIAYALPLAQHAQRQLARAEGAAAGQGGPV